MQEELGFLQKNNTWTQCKLNAFLNGDHEEDIYMHQSPGAEVPLKEDLVCHLKRSL